MTTVSEANCIFCKIIAGSIPSPRVYEDQDFVCIRDIQPQAKTHLLIVPKEHCRSLEEADSARHRWMGRYLEVIAQIARQEGLVSSGYRALLNTGANAGQTVFHIHFHLLGGEPLQASFGRP